MAQGVLTNPGDFIEITEAGVLIRLTRFHGGYSRYVQAGADRVPELCTSYTDETIARTQASRLLADLRAGLNVTQIADRLTAAEVAVLTHAAAIIDQAGVDELAADINATMDAVAADRAEAAARLAADVAEIMTPRRVRITPTRVFRKPLNERQLAAVRGHRNGVVHLGPGVTKPMLNAIQDKGYGTLNYIPGLGLRKVIQSLTLNQRGRDAANGEA